MDSIALSISVTRSLLFFFVPESMQTEEPALIIILPAIRAVEISTSRIDVRSCGLMLY